MKVWKRMLRAGGAGLAGLSIFAQCSLGLAEPLSLEQAVNMALGNHLDIKLAVNTETQAKYALDAARGSRGISLDASNTFYLKRIDYSADSNSSQISLSLPLYSGGKNEGNIAIAQTDVTIAGLDLVKTRQDVKLNTVAAYFDIINYRETIGVDQETVDNYTKHLENVRDQYGAGNLPKSDVLSSEVQLINAQQTLMQDKNKYEVAVNKLKNLIRWDRPDQPELVSGFQHEPLTRSMEDCVDYTKAHHPTLKKYRLNIEEAKQNVGVAAADKKPTVSLTAATGWSSSVLPEDDNKDVYVGVTTAWNLFDSQVTAAKIKEAKSKVDSAYLDLTSQEDSLILSVKEYYLSAKEAEKRMATTQVAIKKADEDYFIAEAKYRIGEGILLDVIDAQLALTTAKDNYIAAQYDYDTYRAKLDNAMGMD